VKSLAVVLAVLSYNVHGLNHWVVSDDPEARMPKISARLNDYDVALIQESWEYWDALASEASHSVKERGSGPQPGTFFHNGLTSFARARFLALTRGSLGACSGWLGGANDCLADKGYLRLRLRLADGIDVDFWNLHLDAGDSADDRAARASQLETLEERVQTVSGGGALVVAGDFNSSAENPDDAALLARFAQALGLENTGARSDSHGAFAQKHIDYIFVRSDSRARCKVLATGEAEEFQDAGAPLSDHPAIFARLEWTRVTGP
jgi:endonuclease/exonuclease/phosphatase family metal-dependent hydrolase